MGREGGGADRQGVLIELRREEGLMGRGRGQEGREVCYSKPRDAVCCPPLLPLHATRHLTSRSSFTRSRVPEFSPLSFSSSSSFLQFCASKMSASFLPSFSPPFVNLETRTQCVLVCFRGETAPFFAAAPDAPPFSTLRHLLLGEG